MGIRNTRVFGRREKAGVSAIVLLAVCGTFLETAEAQNATDDAVASEQPQDTRKLDTVTVMAQKRAQDLQDVPIAVSAFSGDQIADAGAGDLAQLQIVSPSLVATRSDTELFNPVVRIRGIGTSGNNIGLESAVGLFVDGVYQSRTGFGMNDLVDLDRVEVLRGPQGTLFGRNTSAGAISIFTKKPGHAFDYQAEVTATEYDGRIVRGTITGPLVTDKLAVRLTGGINQRDGVIETISGGAVNDRDRSFVRGQALFEPGNDLDFRLIVDWSDANEACCTSVPLIEGPVANLIRALGGELAPAGQRLAAINDPIGNTTESTGLSLEGNYRFGDLTFTSISSFREWEGQQITDADFTTLDFAGGNPALDVDISTMTQEFRLAGQSDSIDWLVGVYYLNEDIELTQRLRFGSQFENYIGGLVGGVSVLSAVSGLPAGSILPEGGGTRDDLTQDAEQFAVFTHNTWQVTDRLSLTAGLRYTDETKSATGRFTADAPGCNTTSISGPLGGLLCLGFWSPLVPDFAPGTEVSSQETTGTINVSYDWTADVMTYASASRGFKGGGFNLERTAAVVTAFDPTVAGDPSFDGETATSYELGVRSTLLDGRVTLNATAFHTRFDDFQILNFSGLQFFIYNVDEVTTQGVELEGVYRATENLTLSGGATYLAAEYGEDNEPIPGLPLLPGNELTAAPELTLTGAVSYDRDIPGTDLRGMANFNVRYQTEQYLNSSLKPQTRQDAYAVANARIGIGSSDDRWAVELFATNLFDEDYSILINDAPLQSGSFNRNPADPRVVGVSLKPRH